MQRRLQIVDLNPYLSCILCGGYFIDATTIAECVHSFCRACIVRFLETSKYCPVCEVQVHKTRPPLQCIRSDKTLQDIVYKLVPGLFHNEMKRRRELYASQPPEAIKESRDAEDRGECLDEKFIYAPDELFSLSVEYGTEIENPESTAEKDDSLPKKRFLRCPAAITVTHLKKFIRMKYGIPNSYEVLLQYDKDELLLDEYTLMDVAYVYLWERKGPMRLYYKIIERPPKVFKASLEIQEKDVKTPDELTPANVESKLELKDSKDISPMSEPKVHPKAESVEEEKCAVNKVNINCDKDKSGAIEGDILKKEVSKLPKDETVGKPQIPTENVINTPCSIKETPSLKFLPTSGSKSCSSESKPAVMTVAPLTKPSTSLATTTSTTASTGTITHGWYTGISIKKSPPNTLRISSHLLETPPQVPSRDPPRVPPLKLSPKFSKLESCIRQMTPKETSSSSKKSSSHSKKSKSKSGIDKLESKVAQLKSASIKSIAPLVISVSHETPKPSENRNIQDTAVASTSEKKTTEATQEKSSPPPPPAAKEETTTTTVHQESSLSTQDSKSSQDDDKMDLDMDIFEGPLVIAEPDPLPSEDSSTDEKPSVPPAKKMVKEDSEDEEIDVVDDIEVDSGRGSDISSRAEARSLSGDDDLGSPESVPKTPDSDNPLPITIPKPPIRIESLEPKHKIPKTNGVSNNNNTSSECSAGSFCGVLDLSTCGRKRNHEGEVLSHRAKPVANPAVLDKTRQTPCRSPELTPFKPSPVVPPINPYKIKESNGRNNFKCRGSNLTVINSDPNGNIPKIVIRKLTPRPERGGHERFHHHHNHHHHQHHQRM